MTDQELSRAIMEAVEPAFLGTAVSIKRGPMKALLAWFEDRGQWCYGWNDPATINQTFNPIPPRWAGAILMHELHRLAWPKGGIELPSDEETRAMRAYAKLQELLRAQA